MGFRKILQNTWRRIVCYVLNNISPSNIYLTLLLLARFHQNCQAAFGCCELTFGMISQRTSWLLADSVQTFTTQLKTFSRGGGGGLFHFMPFGSVFMKVSLHPEHMFLEGIRAGMHLQSGSVNNFLTIMLLANAK